MIGIQLYDDPRALLKLERIAVALESIAETLKTGGAVDIPIDPADISAATERLKKSSDSLAATIEANPVPQ